MDKSTVISTASDDSQCEEQLTTSELSQRPDQSQALAATANPFDADFNAQHAWALCKPRETVIKVHVSSLLNLKCIGGQVNAKR